MPVAWAALRRRRRPSAALLVDSSHGAASRFSDAGRDATACFTAPNGCGFGRNHRSHNERTINVRSRCAGAGQLPPIQQPNILASSKSGSLGCRTGYTDHRGRTRPLLALGRLRAQGTVGDRVEQDDLRFTSAEGIDFLQQHLTEQTVTDSELDDWSAPAAGRRVSSWRRWRSTNIPIRTNSATHSAAHPVRTRDYFLKRHCTSNPKRYGYFCCSVYFATAHRHAVRCRRDATTGKHMLAQLWQAKTSFEPCGKIGHGTIIKTSCRDVAQSVAAMASTNTISTKELLIGIVGKTHRPMPCTICWPPGLGKRPPSLKKSPCNWSNMAKIHACYVGCGSSRKTVFSPS